MSCGMLSISQVFARIVIAFVITLCSSCCVQFFVAVVFSVYTITVLLWIAQWNQ